MNIGNLLNLFTSVSLLDWFFKVFAIVLSGLYFLVSLIIFKKTQVLLKTVRVRTDGIILFISFIQLILVGILLLVAIFYL